MKQEHFTLHFCPSLSRGSVASSSGSVGLCRSAFLPVGSGILAAAPRYRLLCSLPARRPDLSACELPGDPNGTGGILHPLRRAPGWDRDEQYRVAAFSSVTPGFCSVADRERAIPAWADRCPQYWRSGGARVTVAWGSAEPGEKGRVRPLPGAAHLVRWLVLAWGGEGAPSTPGPPPAGHRAAPARSCCTAEAVGT